MIEMWLILIIAVVAGGMTLRKDLIKFREFKIGLKQVENEIQHEK